MMNLNKENTSICVVFLGIFALSFLLHAEGRAIISPFCTEASVSADTQSFCTMKVGTANTWNDAALASVRRIIRKSDRLVKPLLATIEAQLSPNIPISDKFQIMDICKRSYEQAIEDLNGCPKLITDGPFSDYGSTLTSIYTSIEDCKDAIVEENGQPEIVEVTRFTQSMQNLIDVALVISKNDPRVADYNKRLSNGEFKDSAGDPNLIGPITPPSTP